METLIVIVLFWQEPERDIEDIDEVSALKRKVRHLEAQLLSSRKATESGSKKDQVCTNQQLYAGGETYKSQIFS